jgi:hypothetical protein
MAKLFPAVEPTQVSPDSDYTKQLKAELAAAKKAVKQALEQKKALEDSIIRPIDPIETTQVKWICNQKNKEGFLSFPNIRSKLIELFKYAPTKQHLTHQPIVNTLRMDLANTLAKHISDTMSKKLKRNHRWTVKGVNLTGHDYQKLQPHDQVNIVLVHTASLNRSKVGIANEPFYLHYTITFRASELVELCEQY